MGDLVELLNPGLSFPDGEGERFCMEMGDFKRFGKAVVCVEYERDGDAYAPMMLVYEAKSAFVYRQRLDSLLNLVSYGEPYVLIPKAIEDVDGVPSRVTIDCWHYKKTAGVIPLPSHKDLLEPK